MIYNVGQGGGASSADRINYDNTESQLEATNVQDAIDEIDGNLGMPIRIEDNKPQYSPDGGINWVNFSSGVNTIKKILFTPHDSIITANVMRVKCYDEDDNLLSNIVSPIIAGHVSFEYINRLKGQYGNNNIIFTFLSPCTYDGVAKQANDSVTLPYTQTTEHTVIFNE